MSDAGGSPDLPEYTPKPHGDGLWGRYLGAPTWVKVGIPLVVIALVLGVGVLIGQSGSGDSTSSSDQSTEELLALMAAKMAAEQAATTTVPETTTTEAATTTTEEATTTEAETTTTTEATTVPETTTTLAPTTVPVPPPTTATTTTTVPATKPTIPETKPTIPETQPTEPETKPTEPETKPTEPETNPTEPETNPTEPETKPTEPPSSEPVPPGALFASLEDFKTAWNSTAQGSSVGQIGDWVPIDLNGTQADMADIGGNLRVGAVVNGANGAVMQVALGWLPLTDESQQAAQNAAFQDAFSVLIRTVNPAATPEQQSGLASKLGITDAEPPFPTGTTTRATLAPERYLLEAVDVPGYGAVTIVGARASLAR
jgi:hypothetical protein